MKRLILIAGLLLLLAIPAFSMPAGTEGDKPTTVMAAFYEEGTGFAANAGVTVPLGSLFGLYIYEIPSFQAGTENVEGNIIDLAFLSPLGSGWYLGPIVTPLGIDWATDIESGSGDPVSYIKAAVGGIVGKSFGSKVGMGLAVKYKRAYDENAKYVDAKLQVGGFLTVNF